jgi:hypothetical protein
MGGASSAGDAGIEEKSTGAVSRETTSELNISLRLAKACVSRETLDLSTATARSVSRQSYWVVLQVCVYYLGAAPCSKLWRTGDY